MSFDFDPPHASPKPIPIAIINMYPKEKVWLGKQNKTKQNFRLSLNPKTVKDRNRSGIIYTFTIDLNSHLSCVACRCLLPQAINHLLTARSSPITAICVIVCLASYLVTLLVVEAKPFKILIITCQAQY
jgi:hypothetical protein